MRFRQCFFSVIYIKTRNRVQEQSTQRFFFSTFIVGVPTNLGVLVILSANAEFKTVKREIKDGQYGPIAQFFGQGRIVLGTTLEVTGKGSGQLALFGQRATTTSVQAVSCTRHVIV